MHLYRQTIILFGIVIPLLGAALMLGGCFILRSWVDTSYEEKKKNYQICDQGRNQGKDLENQVASQSKHLQRWKRQLREETASSVATNLRQISEHLPGKEIQQTAFERPGGTGGFGAACAQSSSQIRIAYRGTFRTLQRAFLELETRMPQLQLQDLKMEPSPNQTSLINLQVTYTAWEHKDDS